MKVRTTTRELSRWHIYVTNKARTHFETSIANNIKENPKELYSYVNNKTTVRSEITVLKNRDGELAILLHEKAEMLNTFLPAYLLMMAHQKKKLNVCV